MAKKPTPKATSRKPLPATEPSLFGDDSEPAPTPAKGGKVTKAINKVKNAAENRGKRPAKPSGTGSKGEPPPNPSEAILGPSTAKETVLPTPSPSLSSGGTAEVTGGNGTPVYSSTPAVPLVARLKSAEAVKMADTYAGLTDEQRSILDTALSLQREEYDGCVALVVEAGAGTGKTFLLKRLSMALSGRGQYTAFNRSLVEESREKFRDNPMVSVNTTYSLAYREVGSKFSHRLNAARIRSSQIAEILGITDFEVQVPSPTGEEGETMAKLVPAGLMASRVMRAVEQYCKGAAKGLDGRYLSYIDGIDPVVDGKRTYANNERVRDYLAPFLAKAWENLTDPTIGTEENETPALPFSHAVYFKLWQLSDNPVIAADYILLDEDQDSGEVVVDVLRRQKALLILVGDRMQEIYRWLGTVNAADVFPDAPVRWLTQSFRFGQAIADVANKVLETIEGSTLRMRGNPLIASTIGRVAEPKCILTRTNAAAVGEFLRAVAEGKQAYLVGGGQDAVRFVEAALALQQGKPTSHPDLACFSSWKEVQIYVKEDEGAELKLWADLIDAIGAESILAGLRRMPAKEEDAEIVISTAHKSKGRQWSSVRLGSDFPMNSRSTGPEAEKERGRVADDDERKLIYVAVTRAQTTLDVSDCPFFTGRGGLDLGKSVLQAVQESRDAAPSIQSARPATPSIVSTSHAGQFTWAKGKHGDWLARGPAGERGKAVDVYRRDGSKQRKTLGGVVWESDGIALYRVD